MYGWKHFQKKRIKEKKYSHKVKRLGLREYANDVITKQDIICPTIKLDIYYISYSTMSQDRTRSKSKKRKIMARTHDRQEKMLNNYNL